MVYARYIDDSSNMGIDFDTAAGVLSFSTASAPGVTGYNLDRIVFLPKASAARFANTVTAGGVLRAGLGVDLVFSGNAALSASGDYAGDIHAGNRLVFKNREATAGTLALTGTFTGERGSVIAFDPWDVAHPVIPAGEARVEGAGMDGTHPYILNTWQIIPGADHVSAFSITNVTALMEGQSLSKDENPHIYFVSNTVGQVESLYQFQTSDTAWFKGVNVLFRSEDGHLKVRVKEALYCKVGDVPGATAEEKYGNTILTLEYCKAHGGSTYGYSSYAINWIDVMWREAAKEGVTMAAKAAFTNNIPSAVIEVAGTPDVPTTLEIAGKKVLKEYGALNVRSNAVVTLKTTGLDLYDGYVSGLCPMNVYAGGEIRQASGVQFGKNNQVVNLRGGTLRVGTAKAAGSLDSDTYLSYLNLYDGAHVEGTAGLRVAYNNNLARWTSAGTGTNVINGPIVTVGPEGSGRSLFTLDCSADLALNGRIYTYKDAWPSSSLTNCWIQKKGAARVIQNGINFTPAPIVLLDGTWELGSSGLVRASKVFQLKGGTLALADGVEQAFDTLPICTNAVSGIQLGAGAALSVAAGGFAFPVEYPEARLVVTGPPVRDNHRTGLRLGTSAFLSAADLNRISYNGFVVRQDAEGYIRAGSHGTLVLFC